MMIRESDEADSNFKESATVLINVFTLGYFSIVRKWNSVHAIGSYGHVELEDKDWGKIIQDREEKHGDVFGLYHTHPIESEFISSTDTATARAFAYSYGRRMLMIIETDQGWLGSWYVNSDEIVSEAKTFKIPFLDGYFLTFIA